MKRRYQQLSEYDTVREHRGIAPIFPTLSADRSRACPGVNLLFPNSYGACIKSMEVYMPNLQVSLVSYIYLHIKMHTQ